MAGHLTPAGLGVSHHTVNAQGSGGQMLWQ